MQERTEFKILEVDRQWIAGVLAKSGAKLIFEGEIVTTYFDKPSENLVRSGRRLRLRKKADVATLSLRDKYLESLKGFVHEVEVEVSNYDEMLKMLKTLGYQEFKVFSKYRYDYEVDDVVVSFDKYQGDYDKIPEFMTIEADDEDEVYEWAERLGYAKKDCVAISIIDLINKYHK
ncbi:MAG: CYTH domain-containing protein [Candidatus Dojkabacteria bacterium]|nr:MAG: CYTH domain-containing protein [Candidatus Dojkabacteria bacterium]